MASKSPKLKLICITNDEITKSLEKSLVNIIANSIYNKPEFQVLLQTALNPSNI